jgi:uncharacterized peroxidase-related enzyme
MALIDYVSPEDAEGRARELLEGYREEHGESALFNEALANHPSVLDARFEYGTRLLEEGTVDRDLKEFVFVVVSSANECSYCLGDHRNEFVERFGGDETELDHVEAGEFDELGERKRAVARFADQVASDPKRVGDDHLDALRDIGYDESEVVELLVTATLAVSANAIVDALSIHPVDRELREE